MIKSARDLIASGDVEGVVDFAIETYRSILSEGEELDEAKKYIRGLAITHFVLVSQNPRIEKKSKTVQIPGRLGNATVTFPDPSPQARRGVDLLACAGGLPKDLFEKLFVKVTSVTFAPDFKEKLGTLTARERAIIENLVEIVTSTPRVNLPR